MTSFHGEVLCTLGIVDEKRCHAIDTFWGYYNAVTENWTHTVEQSIVEDFRYTSDSFWYRVKIINPSVKVELPRTFDIYEHSFTLVAQQPNTSQLSGTYKCTLQREIVEPLLFWRIHVLDWPILSCWPCQYPVLMLKGLSRRFELSIGRSVLQ